NASGRHYHRQCLAGRPAGRPAALDRGDGGALQPHPVAARAAFTSAEPDSASRTRWIRLELQDAEGQQAPHDRFPGSASPEGGAAGRCHPRRIASRRSPKQRTKPTTIPTVGGIASRSLTTTAAAPTSAATA